MKMEDILKIRSEFGCGLAQARDVILRFGTYEKAIRALKPDNEEPTDPYAKLLIEKVKLDSEILAYRYTLDKILQITTDDAVKLLVAEVKLKVETL